MKNRILIHLIVVLIVIIGITSNVFSQSQKIYDQADYVWDLTEIYETDSDWKAEYDHVWRKIENTYFDHLEAFNNSDQLAEELDSISDLRMLTSKVAYYAILRWEEGKAENGEFLLDKGESILANIEALVTPLEHKIIEIGSAKIQSWLEGNPKLYRHRHWLNLILDQKNHRSSSDVESALRKTRQWISSSIDTYWEIQATNKLWEKYKDENGKEILLNRSAFRKLRRSEDYIYRDEGAKLYYQSLDDISGIMGQIYTNKIKAELDLARLRGFDDGIDANWFLNAGVPKGGYKVLINAARENKHVLQRYARIRGKVLAKNNLQYLDLYKIPNSILDYNYDFSESISNTIEASKMIGEDFYNSLQFVLDNKHWMHLADIPKTANYHIRPPSGEIHPFFILKYKPSIVQARALAGGLFDLATSVSSIGADGTDVLEAPNHISGVLYAGGILYSTVLAQRSENKEIKVAHLLQLLEYLRRFFKNAILIELDAKIQEQIIEDNEVSGISISNYYLDILRDYYGYSENAIEIAEFLKNDWMTETAVIFMPKYEHHFWAPSIAAAVNMIRENRDKDVGQLFLKSYSNDRYDSYSVLKARSIDLMSEKTYNYIFEYMNEIMDEIELLIK